jgi:phosphoribosylformylglycinamidine (FGAM) synthase PurS component
LDIAAANETEAKEKVDLACKKLLVNQIMESFDYVLKEEK